MGQLTIRWRKRGWKRLGRRRRTLREHGVLLPALPPKTERVKVWRRGAGQWLAALPSEVKAVGDETQRGKAEEWIQKSSKGAD